MQVEYRIVGPGWAQCRISHAGVGAQISVSDLSDPLGDLVRTANRLRRATDAITFSWKTGAGEYRWTFKLVASETQLLIEKLDLWGGGDAIFDALVPTEELIKAIAAAGQDILVDLGVDGYKQRWAKHDFPLAELARISGR
jgi:hypothetical protein